MLQLTFSRFDYAGWRGNSRYLGHYSELPDNSDAN